MLFLYSINYQRNTSQVRENYKLSDHQLREVYNQPLVEGLMALQTCNRIELLIQSPYDISHELEKWWHIQAGNTSKTKAHIEIISGDFFVTKYLLELSVGRHSMVRYDDQIIGQLKKTFLDTLEKKWHTTHIERLFQCLMKNYKEVINESSFKKGSVSLAYNTLKIINHHLSETPKADLLIIGAGDMAQQIYKYATKENYNSISFANRHIESLDFIQNAESCARLSFDQMNESIHQYNVIINCIAYNHFDRNTALPHKMIIDLSANNILSSLAEDSDVDCFNLEDISSVIEANHTDIYQLEDEINPIIARSVADYLMWVGKYKYYYRSQVSFA